MSISVPVASLNQKVFWVHQFFYFVYFSLAMLAALGGVLMLVSGTPLDSRLVRLLILLPLAGLIHWCVGRGVRQGERWARVGSAIIGVVLLFLVPLGTIMGAYLLYQLRKYQTAAPASVGADLAK